MFAVLQEEAENNLRDHTGYPVLIQTEKQCWRWQSLVQPRENTDNAFHCLECDFTYDFFRLMTSKCKIVPEYLIIIANPEPVYQKPSSLG